MSARRALLTHQRLIAKRMWLDCLLRFAVAIAIVVGALFGRYAVGIEGLALEPLFATAGVIALYDGLTVLLIRPYREPVNAERVYGFLATIRHVTITFDHLALTVLVYLVGGIRSPFVAVFLLHAVLNGFMITRAAAFGHAIVAYLLLAALAVGEWLGLLTPVLHAGAACSTGPLDGRFVLGILLVYAFLFVAITAMITSLAGVLRRSEQQIRAANEELDRLSSSRRDFLYVALHDLKSPVSAMSMLLDSLSAGHAGGLHEPQQQLVERVRKRLRDVNEFLRELSLLATLDSKELESQRRCLELGPLLERVIEDNRDLASARRQSLTLELEPDLPQLFALERLIREAVHNLVTNAIKYTPDGGHIRVSAYARGLEVRIEVHDDGIGISEADQARLFQDFVRIETARSKVGGQPGSGLGLAIVQRIARSQNGRVEVWSRPGEGSRFTLVLPRCAPDGAPVVDRK